MTGSSKRKGDRAEREVEALLSDALGVHARRAFGAGRRDEIGDITGVPNTVIQVVDWKDVLRAIREKPEECEQQRLELERQLEEPALGATFVRLRGGVYRVVLTPDQFFALWREAA